MTFLQFRDGPLISQDAVLLALDLEARGHTMAARDGKLIVSDGSKLTTADREAIGQARRHLLAFVSYIEEGHEAR